GLRKERGGCLPAGRKGRQSRRCERGKTMLLEGKVAIVTGASRGIGFAVAKAYACEGARVAVCGSREETAQKAVQELQKLCPGAQLLPVGVDVSDGEAIR